MKSEEFIWGVEYVFKDEPQYLCLRGGDSLTNHTGMHKTRESARRKAKLWNDNHVAPGDKYRVVKVKVTMEWPA